MQNLTIHTEVDSNAELVMTVIGELDLQTIPELGSALRRNPVPIDVLDCRFVSFISTGALSILVQERSAHPFRILASTAVDRIIGLCGLAGELQPERPTGLPTLQRAAFGVCVHDSSLRYVYVNDALAAINGLEARAHLGRHPMDLFDVRNNDVLWLLADVLATGIERQVVVEGDTAAGESGCWSCRYRRARIHVPDGPASLVVATVEPFTRTHAGDRAKIEFGHVTSRA